MNIYKYIYFILGMNDVKIKGLKPTMRIKKRFLLLKLQTNTKFDFKTLSYSINEHFLKVLGAHFYGKEALWIIREQFDYNSQEVVIKVKSSGVEMIQAALALGITINNTSYHFEIKHISATLKGLKSNLKNDKK